MSTPFESAQLNLQLFDLRREPVLREARSWFLLDFHPETLAEFVTAATGERNASIRMVLGYWDMAASLVTMGAVDGDAFRAAHGEMFGTFCKVQPFLAEMRAAFCEPAFCRHFEQVVMGAPDAAAILARRREGLRMATAARSAQRESRPLAE